jgi:hypothetical protein
LAGCYYEGGIPGKWKEKVLNKGFIDSMLHNIV